MVFNGRLSALRPSIKEKKDKHTELETTHEIFNTQPLLNLLPYGKLHLMQNAVGGNNLIQNSVSLQSRPSQNKDTKSDNLSGISKNKLKTPLPIEVQTNRDPTVTTKVTHHIPPEVTLYVAGNTFDTIPITVTDSQDSELQKAIESVTDNSGDEVHASVPEKPTTLVLKPAAKAVAGAEGIAIAAPLSRAVVRKGQEVNIHFNPDAVAVAGPGGVAHAHSDLIISYLEDLASQKRENP
jgi:hypothetical protein